MPEIACPDCQIGRIAEHDRCDNCGLSWEAVEDAAAFFDMFLADVKNPPETKHPDA